MFTQTASEFGFSRLLSLCQLCFYRQALSLRGQMTTGISGLVVVYLLSLVSSGKGFPPPRCSDSDVSWVGISQDQLGSCAYPVTVTNSTLASLGRTPSRGVKPAQTIGNERRG